MKVVLRRAVDRLGEPGDVVTVARGYARNYLIPRGLAVPATEGAVRHAEVWRSSRATREARLRAQAEALRGRLEAAPLRIKARAGPDGRLFGSVTSAEVAAALGGAAGVEIDRHDVELEPIRHLGLHEARVTLHPEVTAMVTVEVVATG